MENDVILEAKNIRKYFPMTKGKVPFGKPSFLHAVDDVSFRINKGEIFGIVGESGSGKSTIGRCVLNLLPIDDGEVWFEGERIDNLKRKNLQMVRKNMQMVFQNPLGSFNPKQRIGSSFHEVCRFYNMNIREMNRRILDLLDIIELPAEVLNRLPNQLSGGQLQRLAIARSLLVHPEFVVADEPVSALDVSVQAQILNLILDLREEMGLTIMFISHDLNVVERICDTVAVVYLGTIVEMAPKRELFRNISHPYTKALIDVKPVSHPSLRQDREILCGDIPNAIDVGNECRFCGRCPRFQKGICDKKTPELQMVGQDHFVACHFPLGKEK